MAETLSAEFGKVSVTEDESDGGGSPPPANPPEDEKPPGINPVEPVAVGQRLPEKNTDRIAKALELKQEGNRFFKEREWKKAIRKYHHGQLHVRGILEDFQVPGLEHMMAGSRPTSEEKAVAKEITVTLSNNLAMCLMKTQDWGRVVDYTNKVLETDSKNAKALFRRGVARLNLNSLDEAEGDLRRAEELDPKDEGIKKQLQVVQQRLKQYEKAERKILVPSLPEEKLERLGTSDFISFPDQIAVWERDQVTEPGMAVLAEPPPDRLSLERGALEPEGREQYLKSLESKLGRLQGADSKKLTSKDMISSLTEAREDHMHQFMSSEATNDPWSGSPTAMRNQFAEFEMAEPGEEEEMKKSWSCLCCFSGSGGRRGYRRGRTRQPDLEENRCLMECDELNLAWGTEHSSDIT